MEPHIGWAYQDPDTPTISRELDVFSYKELMRDERSRVTVTARFLVECKQSALPFAGIGYAMPEARFEKNPRQHALPTKEIWSEKMQGDNMLVSHFPAWGLMGFRALAVQHGDDNFRLTQLTRLERERQGAWGASNSGIFTELVYPLAKALLASQEPLRGRVAPPTGGQRSGWAEFGLHFPVVLIGSPLYVVDASSSEYKVQQRNWATVVRQLKSKNVDGLFEFDVVTGDGFEDYVVDRLAFAAALAKRVGEDPLAYTTEGRHPRQWVPDGVSNVPPWQRD
jgi:hypothetical protein